MNPVVIVGIVSTIVGGVIITWGVKQWGMKGNTPALRAFVFLLGTIILVEGVIILGIDYSPGPSSRTAGRLSESTQRKVFYDIIATQDQNPDSNEWCESVLQAAADQYGVPRSTISDIIRRGATEVWLQPDPP